jgi:type I restriction enzyme S subunit
MSKQIVYKETNHFWFPLIPSNWDVIKLKWLAKIYSGGTPDKNKQEYWTDGTIPWLNSGSVNQYIITEPSAFITEEGLQKSSAKWIKKNSILIALAGQGKTKGMSAILDFEATCNQSLGVISPLEHRIYSKYLLYFLTNNYSNIRGIAGESRDGLNLETIGNIKIHLPSLNTQTVISNFLDQKTQEIDSIITKKRKLIDCLKEERIEIINQAVIGNLSNSAKKKLSGFDWVPKIPESWTTNKIKNIAKIFGRIGYRGYQTSDLVNEGEGAITLSPSNMKEFEMDFTKCTYLSWLKYDESPEIQIEDGDILFVKTGSTYGKTSLVKNLPEKATINPQLLVFKEVKINSEFFYFVLLSQLIQAQVSISVIGGTIPTISQEKIGNYYLFVPPIKEQDEIVELVNKHLEQTNLAINKIEQEIDLINEYRAALINEVVTGKITLN